MKQSRTLARNAAALGNFCASILYELANTMVVNSWIECHYGHQADNLTSYKFEYDFSRPIKFTLTGFNLFYQEFDLSMICSRDDNIQIYKDKHNRQFVFYMNYLDAQFKKSKDLYATFLPDEMSANVL